MSHPAGPATVLLAEGGPMLAPTDLVEGAGREAPEAAVAVLSARADVRTVFAGPDMRGSTAGLAFAPAIRDRWPLIGLLLSSRPWDDAQIPSRGVVLGEPSDRRRIAAATRSFAA